jgi:hypothetical protein
MQIPRQASAFQRCICIYVLYICKYICIYMYHMYAYVDAYIHTSASLSASTARSSSIFRLSSAIFRCSSANNPRTISIATASTFRVSEASVPPPPSCQPPTEHVPGGVVVQCPVRNPCKFTKCQKRPRNRPINGQTRPTNTDRGRGADASKKGLEGIKTPTQPRTHLGTH